MRRLCLITRQSCLLWLGLDFCKAIMIELKELLLLHQLNGPTTMFRHEAPDYLLISISSPDRPGAVKWHMSFRRRLHHHVRSTTVLVSPFLCHDTGQLSQFPFSRLRLLRQVLKPEEIFLRTQHFLSETV